LLPWPLMRPRIHPKISIFCRAKLAGPTHRRRAVALEIIDRLHVMVSRIVPRLDGLQVGDVRSAHGHRAGREIVVFRNRYCAPLLARILEWPDDAGVVDFLKGTHRFRPEGPCSRPGLARERPPIPFRSRLPLPVPVAPRNTPRLNRRLTPLPQIASRWRPPLWNRCRSLAGTGRSRSLDGYPASACWRSHCSRP